MKLEYKNLKQLDEFLEMYWNDITAGGTFPPESEDLELLVRNCMSLVENIKDSLKDSESAYFYVITDDEKEQIEALVDDYNELLGKMMNMFPITRNSPDWGTSFSPDKIEKFLERLDKKHRKLGIRTTGKYKARGKTKKRDIY